MVNIKMMLQKEGKSGLGTNNGTVFRPQFVARMPLFVGVVLGVTQVVILILENRSGSNWSLLIGWRN